MKADPMLMSCECCNAAGSIVEMGLCCRVAQLVRIDALTTKYRPLEPARRHWGRVNGRRMEQGSA